ncbi:suppressor of fused domain protein [Mesorhizobium sp. CN2-181]|uniref:suppressor of fused domain protein n=1 Tax=Mesorhizobium yinganensis TaxID=3157707 RepID=UPI0032B8720C
MSAAPHVLSGSALTCIMAFALVCMEARAEEISPGGSTIHRYENVVPDHSTPEGEAIHLKDIEEQLKPLLGEGYVFHEIESTSVHLDVLVFPPRQERNRWTFVTSGMSDRAMSTPEGLDPADYGFSELVIALPGNWFTKDEKGMIPEAELGDWNRYWPVGTLKFLARFPHEYRTWLWEGHSVPNGAPAEPFSPNTKLDGVVLTPLHDWPEQYRTVEASDGTRIGLFAVVPVYPDEMQAKLDLGFDVLMPAFAKAGVSEMVVETRPSVAPGLPR